MFFVESYPVAVALCLVLFVCRADSRPNILFCISDDQSWPHIGAMGDPIVKPPSDLNYCRESVVSALTNDQS